MTKSVEMDTNESIYEEIITRDFIAKPDRKRLDRSLSCPSSRKTSRDMGKHYSATNLRFENSEDNLYAVVQGEDLEFKKLKDLLEEQERNEKSCSFRQDEAVSSAMQIFETADDKDLGETDSGCDCSTLSKDATVSINITRPNKLDLQLSETVYSEILHLSPASQIDFMPGRLTRESDNPILRQEVIPSNTPSPATSVPPSRSGSMRAPRREGGSTRSASGDSGIQEDIQVQLVYENCARRERGLRRSLSSPQFQNVYANATSAKLSEVSVYANMETSGDVVNEITDSVYANMEEESARPRASSRPINIQSNQRKNTAQTELIYSDLDFDEEQIPEYLSSSPGDASSTSSGFSSFTSHMTNTFTPPPLPSRPSSVYARRRQTSFSSISIASSFAGSGSLKANFLGTHSVNKTSKECIDHAVKEVGHKTTMLEIKSVCCEISSNSIKFVNMTSPYNCVLQFSIDEIHLMEQYSKDKRFMGFIVSQPGKEAVCYVFQSDQTSEIIEHVKDTFREIPWKQRFNSPDRPKSLYGLPESQTLFRRINKIGSLKVRKSYLVINDSIHSLLDKTNPKEYRHVDVEITDSYVLVGNTESKENLEHHSIPWILSLGLYNEDGRYFGYIVSRTKNGKTRMYCHVYKCSKVMMSAAILEGIRSACQSALVKNQVPRFSKSMPRDGFRSRLMTSPDAVSRCSTSSDETTRDANSPKMTRTGSVGSRSNASTPKLKRILSLPKENTSISGKNLEKFEEASAEVIAIDENEKPLMVMDEASHDANQVSTSKPDSIISDFHSETVNESEVQKDAQVTLSKSPQKEKKSAFLRGKSKIIRNTLSRKKRDSKLTASMQSLDFSMKEEEEIAIPFEREEHKFVISYLCSAVVKPPLKSKHVEKCLKQYQKEVGKKQKVGESCCIGNKLLLEIVTDEGITMADIRNPNAFRRHFPISTIDLFIVHPENPDCFAFSTTVPGDEQHKYHVFYKVKENVSTIKDAFERLKTMQRNL